MAVFVKDAAAVKRARLTAQGFPRGYLMRQKQVKGFQAGDRVKTLVPTGKKAGTHTGRVAVRASGSFNIQTPQGVIQGMSHRHCKLTQRGDGYGYSQRATHKESEQVTAQARMCDSIASQSALYLPGIHAEVSRAK